jgi:hypothetical protein
MILLNNDLRKGKGGEEWGDKLREWSMKLRVADTHKCRTGRYSAGSRTLFELLGAESVYSVWDFPLAALV